MDRAKSYESLEASLEKEKAAALADSATPQAGSSIELLIKDYEKSFDNEKINDLALGLVNKGIDVAEADKVKGLAEAHNKYKELMESQIDYYKEHIIKLTKEMNDITKSNRDLWAKAYQVEASKKGADTPPASEKPENVFAALSAKPS